ncbi:MAG: protein translocase subunit SecD [Actinomycetota bacterium]|nr:protein translocase subunit SecD [Actinomycetota bacterium]
MSRRRARKSRAGIYLGLILLVAFGSLAAVLASGWAPRLGLDLKGGISVTLSALNETVEPGVLEETKNIIERRVNSLGVAEPEVAVAGDRNILIQLPGVEDEEKALEVIGTTAQLTFRQVEDRITQTGGKNPPKVTTNVTDEVNKETVIYPSADPAEKGVLYKLKPAVLTGEIVERAEAVVDPTNGDWAVSIRMDDEGSAEWARFTGELACLRDKGDELTSQVAIVLDGRVESAAGMRSPQEDPTGGGVVCNEGIAGGETQIDVGGQEEAKNLALVLTTGALPLTMEQSEVQKISPTLGQESLDAGILAGAIGLGLVMIYMILYYRALGFIVWVGLLIFTSLMYSIMAILGETAGLALTLAGVAGIIVSVGVTADSYIVAFERLKDEVRSGKSMRAAVERGMVRSFKTILVADFVTGAAAVILFFLAVGAVKGFALTLGLATIADVVIAYFFTRNAVALLARTKAFSGGGFLGMGKALGVES